MNIETIGKKISDIEVYISYRIIELFSAGLYSSPNKAFEELVSNSYDAMANKVSVYVPLDLAETNAFLWVCDNGESMDSEGLKLLWRIGISNKRDHEDPSTRLQIGRFGIGKLATYVLARNLTYICKNDNKYLAVTMDYSRVNKASAKSERIILDEREVSLNEVKKALTPYIYKDGQNLLSFNLWGKNAEKSWTFCIMTDLKPKAKEIKRGILKWVLRTALPLNPDFCLHYNGSELEPSKLDINPIKEWTIGEEDPTAEKYYEITTHNDKPAINLGHINNIYGKIYLYDDSLATGKSEKLGRSHGIFLMVRNRLINSNDPLLGMDAFTHGAFNRTRIMIHADGLDDYVTSTRESIKESEPFSEVKEYIKRKFNNEVREYWKKRLESIDKENRASNKVILSSGSLSRRPILVAVRRFFNKEISNPILIDIPPNLTSGEQQKILESLENDLTSVHPEIRFLFNIKTCEKNNQRHMFNILRIIF